MSADFWLGLQQDRDLWHALRSEEALLVNSDDYEDEHFAIEDSSADSWLPITVDDHPEYRELSQMPIREFLEGLKSGEVH